MTRKPKEAVRQARNQLYRQHILEAAEKVFSERGFETAKVQEISAQAGLSMGTIYSIFPSKDELFTALLEERGNELRALAREVAARELRARDALHELIEAYVGYFVEHPTFLQMHLKLGSAWILKPRLETDTQLQIWKEIHEHQAAIFRRGIAEGDFLDEDPGYLAKMFSAMDQVVLADWVANGMTADRMTIVRRLQEMVERAFHRPGSAARTGTGGR